MSVTGIVIALTSVISLIAFSNPRILGRFAASPYEIRAEGRWYQMVTSGFLHADFAHLIFNMLTLYFFGPTIESVVGGVGFLVVYLGSMIGGSLLSVLLYSRDKRYRSVGASGGVSGVVFSFVLFRPFAPLYLFFIPIGIPAVLFAVGYLLVSFIGAKRRWGRIGHAAHLGGAITGVALTLVLYPAALKIFLAHFR
jgi:membrane associated rhomboid family serine protease